MLVHVLGFLMALWALGTPSAVAAEPVYKAWAKPASKFALPALPVPPGVTAPAPKYDTCGNSDCGVLLGQYWNIKDPSGQQPYYFWDARLQIQLYPPTARGVDSNLDFVEPAKHGTATEQLAYHQHQNVTKTTTRVQRPDPTPFRKTGTSPIYSVAYTIAHSSDHEDYTEETLVRVSNVVITAHFTFHGSKGARQGLTFPKTKALVDAILSQMEIASGAPAPPPAASPEPKRPAPPEEKTFTPEVRAYPFPGASAGEHALIPASERLPAKFVVTGAQANAVFEAALPAQARGYLLMNGQRALRVRGKTDARGTAEFWYHYTPGKAPLVAAETYEILVSAGGRLLRPTVQVGLGLVPSAIHGLKASTVREASRENTFVIAVGVQSTFHPRLNLLAYLERAKQAGVWKQGRVGMKLVATWLNREEASAPDQFYVGTTNLTGLPENKVILTANERPWYSAPGGNFFYPAVVMGEDGHHIYQINVKAAVLDDTAGGKGGFVDYLDEVGGAAPVILAFSREQPETVLTSLSCMWNPTTDVQYVALEALKKIPGWKTQLDAFLTTTSLVCGLLQGNTEAALVDLSAWAGGKVLDHLESPEVLEKFSLRQQQHIKRAKQAYDKLDTEKKKREIKALHANKGSIGIPTEIFDLPLGDVKMGGSLEPGPTTAPPSPAATPTPTPVAATPPAPSPSTSASPTLKESVQDLKNSFKDLGKSFKDIFK